MLLHLFSESQQLAFCEIAQYLMSADQKVDHREEEFLKAARREMNLGKLPSSAVDERTAVEALELFDSRPSQRVLLLELAGVSLADGVLHQAENDFLLFVADRFRVPADEFAAIMTLVADAIEIADRASTIVGSE